MLALPQLGMPTAMIFGERLFSSQAKSTFSACLIAATAVTAGAIWLIPFAPASPLLKLLAIFGLWCIVAILIRFGYGCRITVRRFPEAYPGGRPRYELRYREASRKGIGFLDIAHITGLTQSHYPAEWWKTLFTSEWREDASTRYCMQFGYSGPAINIRYVLPPHISADQRERCIVIPSGDASTLRTVLESILAENGALSA